MGKPTTTSERRVLIWRDGITWHFEVRLKVDDGKRYSLTSGHGQVVWPGITEKDAVKMVAELIVVSTLDVTVQKPPEKDYAALIGADALQPMTQEELARAQGFDPDAPLSPETKAKLKQIERYRRRGVKRRG